MCIRDRANIIAASVESSCIELKPLTVPRVPTGINLGVLTKPCGVVKMPVLAFVVLQKEIVLKSNTISTKFCHYVFFNLTYYYLKPYL